MGIYLRRLSLYPERTSDEGLSGFFFDKNHQSIQCIMQRWIAAFLGKIELLRKSVAEETYLIVGLGNPGAKYVNTRHNVGFRIVDAIVRSEKGTLGSQKWDARFCQMSLWGARVFFVEPQTFMNLSGKSITRFVDFFKVRGDHILVIHDDIDMHPGRIKLVSGGGPGGHNGIRSLIQCLGTTDFFRLKYGVGRPGRNGVHADIPVERFVLAPFNGDEEVLLAQRMDSLVDGVREFVIAGSQQAMNILNVLK